MNNKPEAQEARIEKILEDLDKLNKVTQKLLNSLDPEKKKVVINPDAFKTEICMKGYTIHSFQEDLDYWTVWLDTDEAYKDGICICNAFNEKSALLEAAEILQLLGEHILKRVG